MRGSSKVFAVTFLLSIIVLPVFAMVRWTCITNDDCSEGCLSLKPGVVFYLGKDTVTQGNWTNAKGSPIGVYGSYAHILPNAPVGEYIEVVLGSFSAPAGPYTPGDLLNPPYNWTVSQVRGLPYHMANPPYWDEYVSKYPLINYSLTGTFYNGIQYPAFEWLWHEKYDDSYKTDPYGQVWNTTDPRACWFNTTTVRNGTWIGGPGTRLTSWDDGSERGFPLNGYLNITLEFPAGYFILSIYAYDYEREINGKDWRPSQTVYITDAAGKILASGKMSGTEFDEGIYLHFLVCGPTKIIVHVVKDEASINVTVSGIFVDKVKLVCGLTIGFWKTNAAKDLELIKGRAQVDKDEYLALLNCVNDTYGGLINDWEEWGIGNHSTTITDDDLEYALHWLSYGAYQPKEGSGTGTWTRPNARDPKVKARAQLLALLLTACYKGSNYKDAWATMPGSDTWQKISDWILQIIYEYNNNYLLVYEMASYLNENYALLPVDP